jgi:hypothetical protein
MDAHTQFEAWFASLTRKQQRAAVRIQDALPTWMAMSLTEGGICTVPVTLCYRDRQFPAVLMTTALREFLDEKAIEIADRAQSQSVEV